MASETKTTVLCGANSYEEKYYLNPKFSNLPKQIKDELQIMCVMYVNDVGGIFLVEYDEDGSLHFRTEAIENDTTYDEIGRSRNCSARRKNCCGHWNCIIKY